MNLDVRPFKTTSNTLIPRIDLLIHQHHIGNRTRLKMSRHRRGNLSLPIYPHFSLPASISRNINTLHIRKLHTHTRTSFPTQPHRRGRTQRPSKLRINTTRNTHPTTDLIPSLKRHRIKFRLTLPINPRTEIHTPIRLPSRDRTIQRRSKKNTLPRLFHMQPPPITRRLMHPTIRLRNLTTPHRQRPRQKINPGSTRHRQPTHTHSRSNTHSHQSTSKRPHNTYPSLSIQTDTD